MYIKMQLLYKSGAKEEHRVEPLAIYQNTMKYADAVTATTEFIRARFMDMLEKRDRGMLDTGVPRILSSEYRGHSAILIDWSQVVQLQIGVSYDDEDSD